MPRSGHDCATLHLNLPGTMTSMSIHPQYAPLRTAFVLATFSALAVATMDVAPAAAQSLLPGSSWSGPYWGVDGGVAWANAKEVRKANELTWGGHFGYGLQLGVLYLGGEVDATWGGASTSSYLSPLYSSTLDVNWTATARARAGLAVGDALLYVTGGAAWSGQTAAIHTLGSKLASENSIVNGTVIGAGIEFKPLPYIAVRLEGLRYDFSHDASDVIKSLPAGVSSSMLKGLGGDETVVRAGVSLRFN